MKGATEQRERDGMKERENAMESVTKGRHDDITTKPFGGWVGVTCVVNTSSERV